MYINNNNITGSLPIITQLTNIQVFDCSYNNFNGVFPNLSTNTALRVVNISNNKFTGRIPDTIENLTNLADLNMSNNELGGSLSAWVKNLPSIKRDGNFFVTTEPSQKTVTEQVVNLTLIAGETVSLKLGADSNSNYTFSETAIWDITGSGGSSSVAAITQTASGTFDITGVALGSAEFTIGLQSRDSTNNSNAEMIVRINTIEVHGVLVRYVETGNNSNIIYQEVFEDIPNGTTFTHNAPDTYFLNGDFIRVGGAARNVTLTGQYAVITVEYNKVTAPVNISYVEESTGEVLRTTSITAQIGSTYTPSVPTYYAKPNDMADGEFRLIPGQNLSYVITSAANNIVVNYERNLSYDQVVIRYVFTDPTTRGS